jgi:hypothetical protein
VAWQEKNSSVAPLALVVVSRVSSSRLPAFADISPLVFAASQSLDGFAMIVNSFMARPAIAISRHKLRVCQTN